MIKKKIKFYANSATESNKLFCFYVNSLQDAKNCLLRLKRLGLTIRKAWYHDASGQQEL